MGNFVSAFSLYEVLRILLPGFYTAIMIKNSVFAHIYRNPIYSDRVDGWIIFLILSVALGGFLYSIDVPRWFKPLYKTLPSNLIEKNHNLELPRGETGRYFENEFFKFYYRIEADAKFKTEVQSGFFHFFMTMAFIGLVFTLVYSFLISNNPLGCEYRMLNASVFILCLCSAIIMHEQKLKYSWKRDYDLFVEDISSTK
ncbi:MAG: hypothetical protein KGJ59_03595 [Bacteroidota bacterium]|nr:hypothetical protein [Bacteroidota bacterium]